MTIDGILNALAANALTLALIWAFWRMKTQPWRTTPLLVWLAACLVIGSTALASLMR